MQLSYTDEQMMLADQARRYLEAEYGFEQRRARQAAGGHDPQVWRSFAGFGWLGLTFAEDHGGIGLGAVSILSLAEELGRALVLEPFLETVIEAGTLIEAGATPEQAAALIAPIIAGEPPMTTTVPNVPLCASSGRAGNCGNASVMGTP